MTRRDDFTGDLFPAIPRAPELMEGALNYSIELRRVLSAMLKRTPFSRYAVAARMSELVGEDITKAQLDAWTAESKEAWRFPFEYAAAVEAACESNDLQELLSRKRGCHVLVGDDFLYAELGRIQAKRVELAEQERRIKRHLGEKKK